MTHDGSVLIPTYQLTDAFGLNEEVAEVTAYLVEHNMSSWAVWDWFASPNTWLDNETPIAVLSSGASTAVQTAAAGLFQE